MKAIPNKHVSARIRNLFLASLMLSAAGCSDNGTPEEHTPLHSKKEVTVTAIQRGAAETRITHTTEDDGTISAAWSKDGTKRDDAFMLYKGSDDEGGTHHGEVFRIASIALEGTGTFTGTDPVGVDGEDYIAVYPARKASAIYKQNVLSLLGQEQSSNGNLDHIADYNYMVTSDIENLTDPILFAPEVAVLRLELTMPNTLTLRTLTLSREDNTDFVIGRKLVDNSNITANSLTMKLAGKPDDNDIYNAHLVVFPTTLTSGVWNVSIVCGNNSNSIYNSTITVSSSGQTLTAGKVYTITPPTEPALISQADYELTNNTTAVNFPSGQDGSAGNPYVIANAGNLKKFIDMGSDRNGKSFKLAHDLYISTTSWTPIDLSDVTFDGQGHTIGGELNIPGSTFYAGFFGTVNSSSISNLHIAAAVDISINTDSDHKIGALAASVENSSSITNCQASGIVTVEGDVPKIYVGSIVGDLQDSHIKSCYAYGKINSELTKGRIICGGIAGRAESKTITYTVTNCTNAAAISVTTATNSIESATGGIVGSCGKEVTLQDCINKGVIDSGSTSGSTGGIVGYTSGSVSNCRNLGNITIKVLDDDCKIGGVAGQLDSAVLMRGCYNEGTITLTDGVLSDYKPKNSLTGGLVGLNNGEIHTSTNNGDVNSLQGHGMTGGLVAMNFGPIYSCCTNTGMVNNVTPPAATLIGTGDGVNDTDDPSEH